MKLKKISRCLVVDDEPEMVDVLKKGFEAMGVETVTSTDILMAHSMVMNEKFRAIIVDYHFGMKDSSGFIEHIKSTKCVNKDTPIFLITGQIEVEEIKSIKKYLEGVILKPFSFRDLVSKIMALDEAS